MGMISLGHEAEEQIAKVVEVAGYLWEREWAESNGGNISVNLTGLLDLEGLDCASFRYVEKDGLPRDSNGMVLFVSGTGERLRDLRHPERAACTLRVDGAASGYHILWGGEGREDFRPTSELISHLKILHDKAVSGSPHRCVVHTHPIELICMTHHPRYGHDEGAFNRAIWSMLPEVRACVSRGVGLAPYRMLGSEALADLTVPLLREHDVVIWEKHGALATGRDALDAFDLVDVANKGAKIFLRCLSSGFEPEGLSEEQMDELVRALNL